MSSTRTRLTLRQMMVAVAISALVFALIYDNTVGSFYGPGGQLDREYAEP